MKYTFFKILENGSKKYCHKFNTLKDVDYLAYKRWCENVKMPFEVIDNDTHKIVLESVKRNKSITKPIDVDNSGASDWYRKGRYMGD